MGEQVSCQVRVSKPKQRGGWEFVSADFALSDTAGRPVLGGQKYGLDTG